MAQFKDAWLEHQRRKWMRPNAHLWIRSDAYRFMPPGSPRWEGRDAVRYFWPDPGADQPQPYDCKYSPDQPRVPAGNSDGGQWTSGGEGVQDQLEQSLATAPDQAFRSDLSELEEIANDPVIHLRIDEAWNASNPYGTSLQEHGFWISRNDATGEFFTRPFANPGSTRSILPGPTPSDAIAFFHTHPLRSDFGGIAGPSRSDVGFAAAVGLPGLLQSHKGMYYFGPPLRPWRPR